MPRSWTPLPMTLAQSPPQEHRTQSLPTGPDSNPPLASLPSCGILGQSRDICSSENLSIEQFGHITGEGGKKETITTFPTASNTTLFSNTTPPSKPQPIQIPVTPAFLRDPDRPVTPLTGRADKRGPLFPFARSPSPNTPASSRSLWATFTPPDHTSSHERCLSTPRPTRVQISFIDSMMHSDQRGARYTPTSPLSPRLPTAARPISPQPSRSRAQHNRKESRGTNAALPRYHPANFPQGDSLPNGAFQTPTFSLHRAPPPTVVETPRLMRERQRELIERAKFSSKMAASNMGIKPDAPRLDPLGSPKGPMTPLALEEQEGDYFDVARVRSSPGASPRSPREELGNETGEGMSRRTPPRDGLTRR